MPFLPNLVAATQQIAGLNEISKAIQKLSDANGSIETTAAAGQLLAELAITTAVTATVRTSMSALWLGLAISGQIWKWEAVSWAAGEYAGMTAGGIIDWVEQSYAQLKESIYGGLVLSTRLKPYLDQIDLIIDEDGIRLDFSAVNTALDVLDGGAENDNCWKMAA